MSDFSTTFLSEILPLMMDSEINVHISCRRGKGFMLSNVETNARARCNAQIFCNKCTYFVQRRERDNLYAGTRCNVCIFLRDRK